MKSGYKIDYSYFKKCKKSVGIDYLRLSYKGLYEYNFSTDSDNSNFQYLYIGYYRLMINCIYRNDTSCTYSFVYTYNGESVPLFQYRKFNNLNLLDFYGSLYRLLEIGEISENFIKNVYHYFQCPDDTSISRIDYRVDFFSDDDIKTPKLEKIIKHNIDYSSIRTWKKGQIMTNWQLGDKTSKGVVFRCYDKLLDTTKKGKDFLYFDYFRFNSVKRLEFECNQKFCKGFTFNQLNLLLDKINKVFGLCDEKWSGAILYRSERKNIVYNKNEINQYLSYIKKGCERLLLNYSIYYDMYNKRNDNINPLIYYFDNMSSLDDKVLLCGMYYDFRLYAENYLKKNGFKLKLLNQISKLR